MSDRLSEYWQRLLDGWPVYVAVAGFLFAYSELWIEKKIREGITAETGPSISQEVALLADDVDDLEGSVDRLDGSIQSLTTEVTATLRLIASE